MALFAGSLHAEIASLHEEANVLDEQLRLTEDQLDAETAAHVASTAHMAGEIQRLKTALALSEAELVATIQRHTEDKAILSRQIDHLKHISEVEMARRDGLIDHLKEKGTKLDLILEQHEWVRDGQCSSHGIVSDVWKCVHCSGNAMANARIIVPQGIKIRTRDEQAEVKA